MTAQISYGRYHRGPWGEASRFLPPPGFQVFAERGARMAGDAREDSVVQCGRHKGRTTAARAHGRRRFERSVPSPGPGRSFAGADDSRGPGDRPTGVRACAAVRPKERCSSNRPQLRSKRQWGWIPTNGLGSRTGTSTAEARVCVLLVVLAALVGLALMIDTLSRSSATYDEVALSERRRQVVADGRLKTRSRGWAHP